MERGSDRGRERKRESQTHIVNPINLASLKFSGRFLVFTAYRVHSEMRKRFHKKGARNAREEESQIST